MGVAENVALVRRYYAMGALNDPKRVTMFADDAVWQDDDPRPTGSVPRLPTNGKGFLLGPRRSRSEPGVA